MSEASTIARPLCLTRRAFAAAKERDYGTLLEFIGPESTWDVSRWGLGIHTGTGAIREFFGDWMGGFDRYDVEVEEMRDLGNGIVHVIAVQTASTKGGGHLRVRYAAVFTWSRDIATCVTHYRDVAEALPAGERLAKQRAGTMSEESTTPNPVEKVRMIFEAVSRQDWDRVLAFYVPDAVFDAPALGETFEGGAAIRDLFVEWTDAYHDWNQTLEDVRDLGNGVVVALVTQAGRLRGGPGVLGQQEVLVYEFALGMITRITSYTDLDEAGPAAERLAKERA
jgi:ketosteroid isomerase-like protein